MPAVRRGRIACITTSSALCAAMQEDLALAAWLTRHAKSANRLAPVILMTGVSQSVSLIHRQAGVRIDIAAVRSMRP